MQTMAHSSTEQIELIRRLNTHTGKKVKIKLYDGTCIEGRLTEFQWAKFAQQVNSAKGLRDSDNLANACFLKEEHGTVTIPYRDIAGFELSF
jgi:hypothetical protein